MNVSWRYLLGILSLVAGSIWLAVLAYPSENLKIVTCDVGQGDAILVNYGKTQILIDGGPNNRVLECLDNHIPFWDREIEVVLLTHPQKDHYHGLIEVFGRYQVQTFIANSLDSSTQGYQVLKKVVGGSGTKVVNPTTGMVIRLGMIYLDIVHPSAEFLAENQQFQEEGASQGVLGASASKKDPNEFSIVFKLSLDNFDALFTGDISPKVIDELLKRIEVGDVEYIKIPHHGSKNGLTEKLISEITPELAIISVGKDNFYGHPHQEALEILENAEVKVRRTDLDGEIVVISDGESFWVQ